MSEPSNSVAFIICSEKGILEQKSILFARSLRKYGGSLKQAPIYSLAPRKGKDISNETIKIFEHLGVNHIHLELNKKHADYGLANKIVSAAYFEKKLSEDQLIFCDSDQLVLNDLRELVLNDYDISMQHVAIKGIGSNGKDENANYWKALYKLLEISEPKLIKSNKDESIFPYFNSGLIAVKRKVGLFHKWSQHFDLVMEKQLVPQQGKFFLEQSVLSATLSKMELKVKVLPKRFNYPLINNFDKADFYKQLDNDNISLLHYHSAFDEGKQIIISQRQLGSTNEKLKWINLQLKDLEINRQLFTSRQSQSIFNQNLDQLKAHFHEQLKKKH